MNRALRQLFLTLVLIFLMSPIVVVGGVSLNAKKSLYFPPQGVSLNWYVELFTESAWLIPIENSMIIATLSSLAAISIALPLAYFLWRYRVFYARALFMLGIAPFMLPPVITALGFLTFWATVGLYGQMVATIVSHAIFFVTLPLVTISLGFESIDRGIIEAAETMGADSKAVFRTVVFPMVRSYMVSGYAFCFVLSLNEYIVAYMVAGFTVETLPIKIFNALRYGYTPVMAVGDDRLRAAGRADLQPYRPLRRPAAADGGAGAGKQKRLAGARHPVRFSVLLAFGLEDVFHFLGGLLFHHNHAVRFGQLDFLREFVDIGRFDEKIRGAELHGLDPFGHRRLTGEQDHLGVRAFLLDALQGFDAPHFGHHQVEHDGVKALLLQFLEGLFGRGCRGHLHAAALHAFGQNVQKPLLIIDD